MNYSESMIDKRILKGLAEMGFVEMTPIQEMAIPVLLEGKDIIGQAQTGTGKTAAFGIPMIENLRSKAGGVQGLILCPTRELAIQACEELKKMAKHVPGVKIGAIYGGQDISKQIRSLKGTRYRKAVSASSWKTFHRGGHAGTCHGPHAQRHVEAGCFADAGPR